MCVCIVWLQSHTFSAQNSDNETKKMPKLKQFSFSTDVWYAEDKYDNNKWTTLAPGLSNFPYFSSIAVINFQMFKTIENMQIWLHKFICLFRWRIKVLATVNENTQQDWFKRNVHFQDQVCSTDNAWGSQNI